MKHSMKIMYLFNIIYKLNNFVQFQCYQFGCIMDTPLRTLRMIGYFSFPSKVKGYLIFSLEIFVNGNECTNTYSKTLNYMSNMQND